MFGFGPFRNRRFVNRQIQGGLITRVGLYWLLYHVVLWHVLLCYRYIQSRMAGAAGQTSAPFGEQLGQLALAYSPVLLCGLFTLPVVLIDMLHLSHRIAGPLVQFGTALRDLREGRRVDRIDLRRQDLLTAFQDEFNKYLASLEQLSAVPTAGEGTPPPLSGSETPIGFRTADRRVAIPVARDFPVSAAVPSARVDLPVGST